MTDEAAIEARLREWLGALSLDEKLGLLDGDWPFWKGIRELGVEDGYHEHPWVAGAVPRLGIPGIRFVDGPRGIVLRGGATTFPVPMARGASWDTELEERIGDAIGRELTALGGNLFGGVCINLLRHPGWGRAQETYGEDPVPLGAFGAALVRGVQRHAMACVKHFAANSIENARFQLDVRIAPRPLHELYLPHFREVVESGVACVMSAYNALNGEWCGQSRALLGGVLKERWGFEGFVLTDFVMGLRDARAGILAGQDLEMPFQMHFHSNLRRLVDAGEVPMQRIDDAATRILRAQLRFAAGEPAPRSVLGCDAHRALARESARKSIVLLRNQGDLLPLDPSCGERIALIGRLASRPNLGDRGSSDGRPEHVVTPLEGIRAALADASRLRCHDGADAGGARALARDSEVALVVVGLSYRDEGEYLVPPDFGPFAHGIPKPGPLRWLFAPRFMQRLWKGLFALGPRLARRRSAKAGFDTSAGGDRRRLGLSPEDEALIRVVAEANPRTVVAVMAGSAVEMEGWRDAVPAILMLWYPGMEGGHALADVLFGAVAPSGRLPFAVPRRAEDLPFFDPDAREIEYDLWHGYRKLARDGVEPAFPFGFGLTTTRFAYGDRLEISDSEPAPDGEIEVRVEVRNTGARDADEVVQLYASAPGSSIERPPRWLVGFARVAVPAGEARTAHIALPLRRLAHFDEAADDFRVEPIAFELAAARHERDEAGPRAIVSVKQSSAPTAMKQSPARPA